MRLRSLLMWTVVALVALDLLGRAVATQLPSPRVFANYNIQRQADRILAANDCADVVVMGTSLMGAAARPSEVESQTAASIDVVNAAVGGGGLLLLEPWAEDLVIPHLCPGLVVIGLGPRDANDNTEATARTRDDYLASLGRRRIVGELDVFGRTDRFLESNVGLFQLRTAYREPANAAAFIVDGSGDWRVSTDDEGQITFFENGRYEPDAAREDGLLAGAFADFSSGGRNMTSLEATIEVLLAADIEVVIVDMPRVESAHQRLLGPAVLATYETSLAELADRVGVDLLQADEVHELDDAGLFADEYHLNRTGSRIFSSWLGSELTGS